jgi:ubiquitin-conjugating enzyme E2 T
MTDSRLNKQLWTDINKLRLLRKADSNVRFLLDKSPFDEFDEEEETGASASPKHIVIIGRILPESEIYREGAYQIEMKLLPTYPFDPPDVRFLTPIYHPNVGKDGKKELQNSNHKLYQYFRQIVR